MRSRLEKPISNKGKFNFIDLLIVLFMVLILLAVVLYFNPQEWFDSFREKEPTGELTYTVVIKGLDFNEAKSIREGNSIRNSNNDSDIGSVVETPKVTGYYEWVQVDEKAEPQLVHKANVSVNVRVKCIYVEGVGYFVNGKQILVGMPMEIIAFDKPYSNCDCIDISYVALEGEFK